MASTRDLGAKKTPAGAEISKTPTKNSKAKTPAAREPTPSSSKTTRVSKRKKADEVEVEVAVAVAVEAEEPNVVEEGPEAGGSRPKRKASRGVHRAVAALNGDVGEEDEGVEEAPVEEAAGSDGSDVDMELEDGGSYEPEETVRGKRAKRKAAADEQKSTRKPTYRMPDLVESAWYQAGSVIIGQLRALIGDDVEAIRQSKVLLEMDLVAPDAFSEVWGGRPDLMTLKKAELVKLGRAAGIKGLSKPLAEAREACKALRYLSANNYKLWRDAEEEEIREAVRQNVLPDQPLWLEKLINNDSSVYRVYKTAVKKSLRLTDDLLGEMRYKAGYYLYRASVAISVAVRWREFNGMDELDIGSVVREDDNFQESLNMEEKLREDLLGRVDLLRKEWEKAGAVADLDEVLESGGLDDGRYHHTKEFIVRGGNDRLQLAVKAMKEVKKWGNPDERYALKIEERFGRFETLSAAFKKSKLAVPAELHPADAGVAGSEVHLVRQQLNISWEFISVGRATVDDSVKAHKAWVEYHDISLIFSESTALILAPRMARWTELAETWDGACGFSIEDVNPGRGMSAAARRTLDVTVGYIELGKHDLEWVLKARKVWLEYRGTYSVSSESAALALVRKMPRWTAVAETWDAACGFSVDDVNPGRSIGDAARRTLDITVAYIERGEHDLNRVLEARKAWLDYHDTYHVSSESAALSLVPKMARWAKLAETWDAACGFSVEDVNPGRSIGDAARRTLDFTVWYIKLGKLELNRVLEARKAWLEYHGTYSVSSESAAMALVPKMARWAKLAETWDAACGFSVDDVNPGRGISAAARRTLDFTVGYIERGELDLDRVLEARKAWLEYHDTYSVSSESAAMALVPKMARWAKLAETWDSACGFSVEVVNPGRGISAAARRTLDFTVGYIERGELNLDRVLEARKAWLEYHDTYHVSSESAALALVPKMARWAKLAETWDAACGFSIDDVHPGRGMSDAARRTLDVTVGYIEHCMVERGEVERGEVKTGKVKRGKVKRIKLDLDQVLEARKAWLEYHDTYSISSEFAALVLAPMIARWTKLAETWDGACGFSIDDVHPGRGISDAAHLALDVTVGYIKRGDYDLDRVRQAQSAYVKYKELRDTESQAVAHERQLERCEEVKAAWFEHQLDDADQLCVPVPPEIAKKYPATTGYILGNDAVNKYLDGVIAARLEMRDKKRSSEDVSLTLEDLERDPRQNHVFICPCGYYSGERKMTKHLELNQWKAVPHHKKGYN